MSRYMQAYTTERFFIVDPSCSCIKTACQYRKDQTGAYNTLPDNASNAWNVNFNNGNVNNNNKNNTNYVRCVR